MPLLRPRFCIYSHYFEPSIGGIESHTRTLANLLQGSGFSVTVVTRTPGKAANNSAFNVSRKPSLADLIVTLRRSEFVIMQGFNVLVYLVAKAFRKKVVWYHHGYDLSSPGAGFFPTYSGITTAYSQVGGEAWLRVPLWISFALGRAIATHDDNVRHIFTSYFMHHAARLSGALGPANRNSCVLYSPLDSDFLAPFSARTKDYDFLMYGRLNVGKGEDVYLAALDALGDSAGWRAAFFGPCKRPGYIEHLLLAHPKIRDRITYIGTVPHDSVIGVLDRARILVVPSVYEEMFGIVATEGMARGLLVVASRTGGLAEIVEGRGLTFQKGDVKELARKLEAVIERPHAYESLAQIGRDWARSELSAEAYLKKFLDFVYA